MWLLPIGISEVEREFGGWGSRRGLDRSFHICLRSCSPRRHPKLNELTIFRNDTVQSLALVRDINELYRTVIVRPRREGTIHRGPQILAPHEVVEEEILSEEAQDAIGATETVFVPRPRNPAA